MSSSPKFVPFPNELIRNIFELLPQSSLLQLRLVNRGTKELLPPPQCIALRSPCQNSLLEAVTHALNAPPSSIDDVKKLTIVTTNDRKEKICGFWMPKPPSLSPRKRRGLVPAVYELMAKLNSGVSPKLTGLHLNVDGLTPGQLTELESLLLEKPEEKWSISTLNLLGNCLARSHPLMALVRKVETLTAVEINYEPCYLPVNQHHLEGVSCSIHGGMNDAISQTVYLRHCSNLKWLVLNERHLKANRDGLDSIKWSHSKAVAFVKAICRLPNLKQLAIVFSGYDGFNDKATATSRAKRAIQDVMEGATHLDRFRICGPADAKSNPRSFEICWEGCRTPSGEVVITEEQTDYSQKGEPGWHHVRF
ncbi:hypothetical protein PG996_011178 [Apiospora saccharicola]|uniref:F-box domain-containing protein n=1 Tax=Apiospora saccharicola TaxID=335842 RepID=A0ABR1UEC2_9PEZI